MSDERRWCSDEPRDCGSCIANRSEKWWLCPECYHWRAPYSTVVKDKVLAAFLAEVARQDAGGFAIDGLPGVHREVWRAAYHFREALRLSKEGA